MGTVAALSGIVDVIFDITTTKQRSAAVKRLVDETPNLAVTGRVLRSFFVKSSAVSAGNVRAPYANLVAIERASVVSTQGTLQVMAQKQVEPIRTAELLRELRKRQALLAERTGDLPNSVPAAVAVAIDAWQEALEKFSKEALKPDVKDLRDRLGHLAQE